MHPQNICACVFSILIAPSTATVKKTCMQIPPPLLWWMSRMITILACENNIDWEREREAKWKMRWLLKYVLPDKLKLHLSKCLQEPVRMNVLVLKLFTADVDWRRAEQSGHPAGFLFFFIISSPIFSRSVSSAGWSFSCLQFILLLRWEGHAQILSAPCLLSRGGKHCSNSLFPSRPEGPACTECCLMFASPSGAEGELKTLARYLQFSRPRQRGQLIQSVLQPSRQLPVWHHWCYS